MKPTLLELRNGINQRAQATANRDVIEYNSLLADLVERAKVELTELAHAIPTTGKIVTEEGNKYPLSQNDPPSLRTAIKDFHDVLGAAKQICETNALRIEQRLKYIESAGPDSFRRYSPKILAEEERRVLMSLLGGSAFLNNLPSELIRLETPITEAVAFWAGREWNPSPGATCQPAPAVEDNQQDRFDSRLS